MSDIFENKEIKIPQQKTDLFSVACLHVIDAESANSDEPSYVNLNFVLTPEDDGALGVHFNGPTDLKDIFIQTEAGDKFELQVSQDGSEYEPYTDENGDVKVKMFTQVSLSISSICLVFLVTD